MFELLSLRALLAARRHADLRPRVGEPPGAHHPARRRRGAGGSAGDLRRHLRRGRGPGHRPLGAPGQLHRRAHRAGDPRRAQRAPGPAGGQPHLPAGGALRRRHHLSRLRGDQHAAAGRTHPAFWLRTKDAAKVAEIDVVESWGGGAAMQSGAPGLLLAVLPPPGQHGVPRGRLPRGHDRLARVLHRVHLHGPGPGPRQRLRDPHPVLRRRRGDLVGRPLAPGPGVPAHPAQAQLPRGRAAHLRRDRHGPVDVRRPRLGAGRGAAPDRRPGGRSARRDHHPRRDPGAPRPRPGHLLLLLRHPDRPAPGRTGLADRQGRLQRRPGHRPVRRRHRGHGPRARRRDRLPDVPGPDRRGRSRGPVAGLGGRDHRRGRQRRRPRRPLRASPATRRTAPP